MVWDKFLCKLQPVKQKRRNEDDGSSSGSEDEPQNFNDTLSCLKTEQNLRKKVIERRNTFLKQTFMDFVEEKYLNMKKRERYVEVKPQEIKEEFDTKKLTNEYMRKKKFKDFIDYISFADFVQKYRDKPGD